MPELIKSELHSFPVTVNVEVCLVNTDTTGDNFSGIYINNNNKHNNDKYSLCLTKYKCKQLSVRANDEGRECDSQGGRAVKGHLEVGQ